MPLPDWQLFDRVRAYLRRANIFRQEGLFQDQTQPDRILSGGDVIEFSKTAGLLEQTNLQINRLERYKDYDMMDEVGEITLALDIYADEASLTDPERKHSVVVKSKSKKIAQVVEDLLYNVLLIDNHVRPMIRYLCKYGDFASEIVPTKNRDGISSLRFINIYNFTRVQTKYGDLVGFYYQDPNTLTPYFLHPWQVMHMRLTSFEQIYNPYGRCQDINGPIWTPLGFKKLKDIQKGDQVYSFDEFNQKPVVTTVLDKVISGIKKTVIIKTRHRCIRVTPEHPILAIVKENYVRSKILVSETDRNSAHYQEYLKRDIKTKKYIMAKDLIKGDKLVLPKLHNIGIDIPIEKYKIEGHAGKRMSIPDHVNEDFAKLMGFLIGDGWIPNSNHNQICFAEGEYKEVNEKYINIIKSFGYEQDPVHEDGDNSEFGYYRVNSGELARTISQMGLIGRCYEKRIPKWVFLARNEIKKAFIEGLVDSDGSTNIDKWNCVRYQIELTSEGLIEDLKVLLDQMNVKCGNISRRNRQTLTTIIHGEEYKRRNSWILYWFDAKMPSGDLLHKGKKRTKYDNSSDDYLVETILSIEDGGEVEVGDIQVSQHHNFISNGVVIHNSILDGSRKDFKRLRMMEDAALIYRITRAPEKRIFSIPIGNIPANQIHMYITEIARQFKKHKFVDPATGQVNERYSPLIQEDDFFLPKRPDGSGPEITTLPGAQNLDQIEDILYFKKKMIAGTKIPFSRVGIGEQSDSDSKSLSSVSPEFAKAVQWIQRECTTGLKKVVIVHLALQGYSIDEIKDFDLHMTASSAIDELYRIETWNTRADIIRSLKESGLFPADWILRRFTDMTDDEIHQLEKDQKAAAEKAAESGQPKGPDELGMGGEGGEGGLDLGGLGLESTKEDDEKLLQEYAAFEKRLTVHRRIVLEDRPTTPVEWFVNANEMDNFPKTDEDNESTPVLVKSIIEDADAVKKEFRDILIESENNDGDDGENSDVKESDLPKQ